jgi:GNAT superfamily N-acetyltransferase
MSVAREDVTLGDSLPGPPCGLVRSRMQIRRAGEADADAVGDVFLAARDEMTYLPSLHTEEETRLWVRDILLRTREVWVAEVGQRVTGFAALSGDFLEQLYVHPENQNQGVGAALLEVAKGRRPGGLRLWVFQKNLGARRFYERHGFSLARLTDGSRNEEREPDVLYDWSGYP